MKGREKKRRVDAGLFLFSLVFGRLRGGAPRTGRDGAGFTDSAGREVILPERIEKIAPSGAYAQVVLYTLCPEKLLGLSSPFSRKQKAYIDERYWELPVFGQFYGKNATMNFEEIIKAGPDVIIDIGEAKNGIASDMDGIQEQTGIPVIFIETSFETMALAYDTLGGLLDVNERASELSAFTREVQHLAKTNRSELDEGERVSVLYGDGEYGLSVCGQNSVHSEVIEIIGGINAAQLDKASDSGRDEVSIEQVILWNPDIVILAPDSCYPDIYDDPAWAEVSAVREGRVFEIPSGPYSWMDRPPSVQRVLGALWLGNLLYPEVYDYDMAEKAIEFYKLFFGYELSPNEARALMANSTYTTRR